MKASHVTRLVQKYVEDKDEGLTLHLASGIHAAKHNAFVGRPAKPQHT
jgi:hypothetical protein